MIRSVRRLDMRDLSPDETPVRSSHCPDAPPRRSRASATTKARAIAREFIATGRS